MLKCPHCGEEKDGIDPGNHEDGDTFVCSDCGETMTLWGSELVDENDYHEYSCDSRAARDYESRMYGPDSR